MSPNKQNPYIGPRTFRTDESDLFFGREREAMDLLSLVISERLVLFYAQSGAGKSSLVNAKLIPELHAEEEYGVLPIGRVKGDREGLKVENIYVFNLISSLAQHSGQVDILSKLTLCEFLAKLDVNQAGYFYNKDLSGQSQQTEDGLVKKRVLIIDQFEELFTTHPEAWEKREDFFRQLAQAMHEFPYLWIVLVMREDYIAYLDPYAQFLPGRLRVRYYMQRLERDAALEAIKNPVQHLRPYANGVAELLVDNLARIRVQRPGGGQIDQAGQFIEPVQLQVVCHNLWEHLSEGMQITEKHLQDVGDVDLSLERYYDERVSGVAANQHISERRIREWFDKELITSNGTRDMVLRNASNATGLDDNVIQMFLGDLVRAELRTGQIWYELSHDRLIEPVRKSNAKWFEQNLSRFQRQVLLWLQQGRSESLLLRGGELQAAETESQTLELTSDEQAFLEDCQKLKRHERREQTQQRSIVAALVASLVLLLIAGFAIVRANQATQVAREEAQRATTYAALFLAQSQKFPLSLLVTVEAYRRLDNYQTRGALLDITQTSPHLRQMLFGHSDSVNNVDFSPDGKVMATASKDTKIILWDVTTQKPKGQPLEGHTSFVQSVAFSPNGHWLASGGDDNAVLLWDLTSDPPLRLQLEGPGHSDSVHSVAFSPDGKLLASGSWDDTVILWDVARRRPIGEPLTGHTYNVYSVDFSPDGKILASGSLDKTIILWDVATHQAIGSPLQANNEYVETVAFSPDGKILASGSYDGSVAFWDVATHQKISSTKGHSNFVSNLDFRQDGNLLASASADGTIVLWDMATRRPQDDPLRGHNGTVYDVAFGSDGTLASAGSDKSVILWDVNPVSRISRFMREHQDTINSISISPDGKMIASGSDDSSFILWDTASQQPISLPHSEMGHWIKAVAFSPDGRLIALGSYSAGVAVWEFDKAQLTGLPRRRDKAYDYVFSLAFSPDGKILASGNWEDTIILWDMNTLEQLAELQGHDPSGDAGRLAITNLAFSPDGKLLASASDDQTIILWDTATYQPIDRLDEHTGSVKAVAFSPDGRILASASSDGNIILWNTESRQPIVQFSGALGSVNTIAINPDGRTLAAGNSDRTVVLWDMATGKPIGQPLTGHSSSVYSLVFTPDGRKLISAGQEIIVWDLDAQEWLEISCQRAGRNLTIDEWIQYFPNDEYRAICPHFPLESK